MNTLVSQKYAYGSGLKFKLMLNPTRYMYILNTCASVQVILVLIYLFSFGVLVHDIDFLINLLNNGFLYILQIIEFISVLLSSGNEAAEKEVIQLGALKRILDLFFE